VNWKTFFAMLARDAHVARRNVIPLVMQTMLQRDGFEWDDGREL
jgi:hypothetical protein